LKTLAWMAVLWMGVQTAAARPAGEAAPPSVLFQELYARVEQQHLFTDDKTFADAAPRRSPAAIMADYRAHPPSTREGLAVFVAANFTAPSDAQPAAPSGVRRSLRDHIADLWPVLTRPPAPPPPFGSQLALARPYVVPGGRFREIYYWDSYFTMLGLVRDGRSDLAADMTDDFADLIDEYGHIPNGTRTYYLSRSQPPVFYLMTGLADAGRDHLNALRREYAYWMWGAAHLRPGQASANVVRMPDGSLLNRYWDDLDTPRDEAFSADTALAATTRRPARALYRDIRAAAESGWDFSSRWLEDGRSLASIETTDIVPVDLNSLLFGLEQAIAKGCNRVRDAACVADFDGRARRRSAAISRYLWDPASRRYLDYQWRRGRRLDRPSAAMLYPLFVGQASGDQARGVAVAVKRDLLEPGGLRATALRTGQQWDAPNGWAPLQWIAIQGLDAYGEHRLARLIAVRWLMSVCRTYAQTGKLMEKYDVETARPGGGGEYPLQDGFGWTNGVTWALLGLYPGVLDDGAPATAPCPGGNLSQRERSSAASAATGVMRQAPYPLTLPSLRDGPSLSLWERVQATGRGRPGWPSSHSSSGRSQPPRSAAAA
jgi:alpha,alpha-trehalase